MSLLSIVSGWLPNSVQQSLTPDIEDLSLLLKAILPTFIAAVNRKRNAHQYPLELHSLDTPPLSAQPSDKIACDRDYYLHLYTGLINLQAVLIGWSPADLIQSSSADEARMALLLQGVLSCIELCFLSRREENVGPVFKRLGIEKTCNTKFWKLRALEKSEKSSANKEMPNYIHEIDFVIRLDNHKVAKHRDKLLLGVEEAYDFFANLKIFIAEPTLSCPLQYLNYPMIHVSKQTKILFNTIQSKWSSCECDASQSHVDRKARWNLTQHQRFDTVLTREDVQEAKARDVWECYRIFFPTTAPKTEWQDTDIEFRRDIDEDNWEIRKDLCKFISGAPARTRPRMAVWTPQSRRELRRLRPVPEELPSVLTQMEEAKFVSLTELLLEHSSHRRGRFSRGSPGDTTWKLKDRLILSFILATTLLHLHQINGVRLRADFDTDSIFFLRPSQRVTPQITRPYLTVNFAPHLSTHRQTSASGWNKAHRFPDILALGILLLEIERGALIKVDTTQDPCVVALTAFDDWAMLPSPLAPDGLRNAIAACIQPKQLETHNLNKINIQDNDVRRYIFDRILYPLEDALFTTYGIRPHKLFADSEPNKAVVEISGSFDGEEDKEVDKSQRAAAKEWTKNLKGVHNLVYACQRQCEQLTRRAERVKIAVLDSGLLLPKHLRDNYEAAGRIIVNESKSFVRKTDRVVSEHDWDSDCDGHGSRVGEIILRCSPCADLHVAKVFETREDLQSSVPATQDRLHKQIAEAIDVATDIWKVDMIVICFGFYKPIRPIRDAIQRALKATKPPLFFAATGNNGAHEDIAWPARESSVIGISSTTAYGKPSLWNPPKEDRTHPILYAFGEGVPVKVAASNNPKHFEEKHVSGTSFATPIAASLAANLLGSARMLREACSETDRKCFADVIGNLQTRDGMLQVLYGRMQRKDHDGNESLLPWDFLSVNMMKENKLLKEVDDAMNGK